MSKVSSILRSSNLLLFAICSICTADSRERRAHSTPRRSVSSAVGKARLHVRVATTPCQCKPPCANGRCVAGACVCDAGWAGASCDQCSPSLCNGFPCVGSPSNFTCQCGTPPLPYTYDATCNAPCAPARSTCKNGGLCRMETTAPYYSCACNATIAFGQDCEMTFPCMFSTTPCRNNGTCASMPFVKCVVYICLLSFLSLFFFLLLRLCCRVVWLFD